MNFVAHNKPSPFSHSRSSSVSSHRVPVPPLIPNTHHSLPIMDVIPPFVCRTSTLRHQDNSSIHEKFPSNQSITPFPESDSPIFETPSANSKTSAEQLDHPYNLPPSSPAPPNLDKAVQRIHFSLPCPPAPAHRTRRLSKTTPLLPNQRPGHHYRVHSAKSGEYQSEQSKFMPNHTHSAFFNQHANLPFHCNFLGSFWGLFVAFGAWLANWCSKTALALRSFSQAISRKVANLFLRWRHGNRAYLSSDNRQSTPSDSIEESYVPVDFPPNLAVQISTTECGQVEIDFGMLPSERGIEVPYQIYRQTGDINLVIKADILYLQDSPFTTTSIPPFLAAFIRDGYRLIIPHMKMANSVCRFGQAGQSTDIGGKARLAAEVIQKVREKDASDRAAKLKEDIATERLAKRKAAEENMTASEKIKHAANESVDPTLEVQALSGTSNQQLFNSDSLIDHRPIFLLGLGHGALVALTYPIENLSTSKFPCKISPSALSFPSVSLRAEPSETLLSKLNSFRGSVSSGLSGTGWWARDPNGEGKGRTHGPSDSKGCSCKCAEAAEAIKVSGIIAIAPTLDPNQAVKSNHMFPRFSRRSEKLPCGVGPTAYAPSIKSAIDRLHLNAHKIRMPVLIAHGTKEAYSCIAGINSLYKSLSSPDCTLLFCPTLRHNVDLATDAARNGLATESLSWMSQRVKYNQTDNQVKLLGQGVGVTHDSLPDPARLPLTTLLNGTSAFTSRKSTSREAISDVIQDRFGETSDTRSEGEKPHYIRSSSSVSWNVQSMSSSTADNEFLEELREDPKNRISMSSSVGVTLPLPSPSPSSSHYPPTQYSSLGSFDFSRSQSSIYTNASDRNENAKFPADLSQPSSLEVLNLPFENRNDSVSLSRSQSPSGLSEASSPEPLTPQGDVFPMTPNVCVVITKENRRNLIDKHVLSSALDLESSIITRPSSDSLCIEIPGSCLGIDY